MRSCLGDPLQGGIQIAPLLYINACVLGLKLFSTLPPSLPGEVKLLVEKPLDFVLGSMSLRYVPIG